MNADKWKSVVIAIGTYKKLKTRAVKNHRTISGEFTHILEQANLYELGVLASKMMQEKDRSHSIIEDLRKEVSRLREGIRALGSN